MYVGLQIPEDQRQIASALPMHLVDILSVADEAHTLPDAFGSMLQVSLLNLTILIHLFNSLFHMNS